MLGRKWPCPAGVSPHPAGGVSAQLTSRQIVKNFQDVKHSFGADHGETLAISFGDIIHESDIPGSGKEKEGFLNARFREKGLQMELIGVKLYLGRELVENVMP